MLINFSPASMTVMEQYKMQDDTDILMEMDRIDNTKYKPTECERRFLNATLCKSEFL